MGDDSISTTNVLPPYWWLKQEARLNLGIWFLRCIVGRFVSCQINDDNQVALYTGFLIVVDGDWFWISAGHCVKQIRDLIAEAGKTAQIEAMRWIDDNNVRDGQSIPIAYQLLDMIYSADDITDIGIVRLRTHDGNALEANPSLRQIGSDLRDTPLPIAPVGYYLLGFPGEWGQLRSIADPVTM